MTYFFTVKVVVASSERVKCSISLRHEVRVNTIVMSQWVGDVIDTNQSYDQHTRYYTQDPGKPGSFTQDQGGKNTWILYLKTWI